MKLKNLALTCQVLFLLCKGNLQYDEELLDWFETQEKCKSEKGILPGKIQINSTETIRVWHGTYRRISAWIKILGCYKDNTTKELSTLVHRMKTLSKSAGFCQEICFSFNMSIFALKGNLCRCLKQRPQEKPVSPLKCNALCYASDERSEKPYFDECGGNGTYSVYISVTRRERRPTSNGTFCVATQCLPSGNYQFHFGELCSQAFQPVCQLGNSKGSTISGNWSMAMQICKSLPYSSYLTGDVFLDDNNRTCNETGSGVKEKGWLGIANEVYFGVDRGKPIIKDDRDLFIQCQLCTYMYNMSRECIFAKCDIEQNISFVCFQEKGKMNDDLLPRYTLATSTLVPLHGNYVTSAVSKASTPTKRVSTFTQTTEIENFSTKGENEEAFQIILPVVIAIGVCGLILALIFTYFCYSRRKTPKLRKQNSKQEKREQPATFPRVTGIINQSYLTIELQEQSIESSDQEDKLDDPFNQTLEETYSRILDKDANKMTNDPDYPYDTTRDAVAKIEQYNQSKERVYDRLGNNERSDQSTDDTYHHACTIPIGKSHYDVTEVRKQYILDSPYNHIEIISTEVNTEQDTISSLSEKNNEDHTYFILEQN